MHPCLSSHGQLDLLGKEVGIVPVQSLNGFYWQVEASEVP